MRIEIGFDRAWRLILGIAGLVYGLNGAALAETQVVPAGTGTAVSRSGQFVVYGHQMVEPAWPLSNLLTNRLYVQLEPALVTVSGERIKQMLLRALEATDTWSGKVYLVLHPTQTQNDTITVTSERFKDNWRYRVDLPDLVERRRYVRVLVQVLLLEMANRGATDHSAEIPPWLAEGLVQDLLVANEMEPILSPPNRTVNGVTLTATQVNARQKHPLARAQRVLCAQTPLTFQELSWPAQEDDSGIAAMVYACSAQVFVHELMHLPNGRANLRALIGQLPRYYNWQLALLHAFGTQFERPLDIEKWWALRLAQFTGRSLGDTWSLAESWRKLDEAVRLKVQVRSTGTNQQPLRAEVTLQTIVWEWAPAQRNQALRNQVRGLQLLRQHIAPELKPLVDDYRVALDAFLRPPQSKSSFFTLPFRKREPRPATVDETLQRLNRCDMRLARMRPVGKPVQEPVGESLSTAQSRNQAF